MSARARFAATLLAASVAAVGFCAGPAAAGPVAAAPAVTTSRGVTVPAFYTPPTTLPSANGALIRTEPFTLALSLPGINRQMPATATRIMYKTTDSNGQPAAVTGAYLEPDTKWTGSGARPLVVVAPGTMGQGDQCSTSLTLSNGLVLGVGDGGEATASLGYELLSIDRLLSKGIAVVETDYVGLGTTDRLHTYVNRVDEGHAVLDAARAARQLSGTSLTPASKVGLYGYSQGGGAVAAAAELDAGYAPDVQLTATYAGAPPADLAAVTAAIDGSELVGALGWSINGFVQSDPALKPLLNKYLSASGQAALSNLSTMCVGDAVLAYSDQKSSAWTSNGQTISQIIAEEPAIKAFVNQQFIGDLKPAGIVRVASGINDNLVPHAQVRTMAQDWCNLGGKVVYAPINTPNVGSPLVNHFLPLLADQGDAVNWLSDRLAGIPALSQCALLPFQP